MLLILQEVTKNRFYVVVNLFAFSVQNVHHKRVLKGEVLGWTRKGVGYPVVHCLYARHKLQEPQDQTDVG